MCTVHNQWGIVAKATPPPWRPPHYWALFWRTGWRKRNPPPPPWFRRVSRLLVIHKIIKLSHWKPKPKVGKCLNHRIGGNRFFWATLCTTCNHKEPSACTDFQNKQAGQVCRSLSLSYWIPPAFSLYPFSSVLLVWTLWLLLQLLAFQWLLFQL